MLECWLLDVDWMLHIGCGMLDIGIRLWVGVMALWIGTKFELQTSLSDEYYTEVLTGALDALTKIVGDKVFSFSNSLLTSHFSCLALPFSFLYSTTKN